MRLLSGQIRFIGFIPQPDKAYAAQLSFDERKRYITKVLKSVYEEAKPEIDRKAQAYAAYWNRHSAQIQQALSEAFETAIHEIIHFVWFYVWNQVFLNSYEEYECRSLKCHFE